MHAGAQRRPVGEADGPRAPACMLRRRGGGGVVDILLEMTLPSSQLEKRKRLLSGGHLGVSKTVVLSQLGHEVAGAQRKHFL